MVRPRPAILRQARAAAKRSRGPCLSVGYLRLRAVFRFAVRRAGFFAAAFFTERLLFLAAIGIYSSLLPFERTRLAPPETRKI